MKPFSILLVALVICGTLSAQQTGGPNRDYTINGSGSFGTSYIAHTMIAGTVLNNNYATQDSLAPVIWAASYVGTLGLLVTGTNSVDLGWPFVFIIDGTLPGLPGIFYRTLPGGSFAISVPTIPAMTGPPIHLQFAHVSGTSPDGFYASQAHRVVVATATASCPTPNPTANLLLSDDSSSVQNLGFSFSFYGSAYTQVSVGSNGVLTFGGSTPGWGAQSELISVGFPIIHLWQRDLYPPGSTGMGHSAISFQAIPAQGQALIQYDHLPPCCSSYNGQNGLSLCATLMPGSIVVSYTEGSIFQSNGAYGTVGVGPGVAANQVAINFSSGTTPITPGDSVYENAPVNLIGFNIAYSLDVLGRPALVTFF